MRSACSERDEYCDTTIAVEVAATTAKAAPSHQRTPKNRLVMGERLRREAPYGVHCFRKAARVRAGAGPPEHDLHVFERRQLFDGRGRDTDPEHLRRLPSRELPRV